MSLELNNFIPLSKYLCLDIKDFYLQSDMTECIYILINLDLIPLDF